MASAAPAAIAPCTRPITNPTLPAPARTPTSPKAGGKRSGARIFVDTLKEMGVEVIFGFPGGAVLPIFDALYNFGHPMKFILSRHEQGAGHMADGFARASGKVGVALVTSGPGATNMATPLATALMDSVPLVCFSGQVKTFLIGNDAFQECDTTGVTRPITKHNVLVKDVRDLARAIKEAFYIAKTGRPGPVLVDLPVDVTTMELEDGSYSTGYNLPGYRVRTVPHARQVKLAAEAINAAKCPVVYAGGGVLAANASAELREFCRKGNMPCTTTLMGMGAVDEFDPKSLWMLGMHGTAWANFAVQAADVLISVGARFDDRVTADLGKFAPRAKIIHIDIDPSSVGKNVMVDIPVVGDAKACLVELTRHLETKDRSAWLAQIDSWRQQHPLVYNRESEVIKPELVIEEVNKLTRSDAVICTGVGQHQMWAAQYYRWRFPRQFITSGGLGTMGFGMPSAIGAALARPDKVVVDFDGDGSFLMTITELATAAEYNIPIKVVILNNNYQGMVRQWQELFYAKRYLGVKMTNPCFATLAQGFGATGLVVKTKAELVPMLQKMLATPGPVVVDVQTDPAENVYPMVPPGKGLHEMVFDPKMAEYLGKDKAVDPTILT